ncbi:MAG: dolichyl-P-Man:Man(7)GlcNAc(2)-PP-dolichol alpha-1,6-mannosyltransferase [Vezdaea aestivalis]|nr:MAG: dolichyl-P-Man:Man(7)GlcNAc(2)-PP-dolichol alpha-1,6-mannosyltransferase [Vezdaea aestivalis]
MFFPASELGGWNVTEVMVQLRELQFNGNGMRRSIIDSMLAASLPALILLHLYISPFTKVEESFNLQATHDILKYGVPTNHIDSTLRKYYDHLTFSGSVPRTFVGPLLLGGVSTPLVALFPRIDQQLVIRAILGLYNAFALLVFKNHVTKAFGRDVGTWYILLQASQFHIIYYASRTLPNQFAFGLTTLGLSMCLPTIAHPAEKRIQNRQRVGLYLLTFAGVVFRSEIALLIFTLSSYNLITSRMSLTKVVIPAGLVGTLVGLLISVPTDMFFWRSSIPLWSELQGFIFNVVQSKSSEWGISSWHYYFTSAVPRLLINPLCLLLLIPLPLLLPPYRKRALDLGIPAVSFVALYSIQPHKEWRFIIYIIPQLTAISALGAHWIWMRRAKSLTYRFLALLLLSSVLASFFASTAMAVVSSYNYPGGHALRHLHQIPQGNRRIVNVHMDVLSCMTGVSRFQEKSATELTFWTYDKTEDPEMLLRPDFWERFDYVLAERPEKIIGSWEIIETINGFAGIQLLQSNQYSVSDNEADGTSTWLRVFEKWARNNITQGRWITIKMRPRIRILRKQITSIA